MFQGLGSVALAVSLPIIVGMVLVAVVLGHNQPAERRGETFVARYQIWPKLVGIATGLGVIVLSVMVVASATADGVSLPRDVLVPLMALPVVAFVGSAWALMPIFARVEFDSENMCATMDQFLKRRRCHAWADLVQIDKRFNAVILRFAGGDKVVAGFVMSGFNDLQDFASRVLASREGRRTI